MVDHQPSRFSALSFFTDDEKVEFYTGITSLKKLCSLFHNLELQMGVQDPYEQLPLFEQFCLTMMNLRLSLQPKDLSVLFHLPEFEVSQCISRLMSSMLVFFVPTSWPKYVGGKKYALLQQILTDKGIGKCSYIVDLVKVHVENEGTLNYFVAFSLNGLVRYVSSGFPESFEQEIEKWELLSLLKQLSHGDKIVVKINNQIKIYECYMKKQLNRTLLTINKDISEELNIWTQTILDPFKRRFAVFSNSPFTPVQSSPNLKATNSRFKVDQIVKICCAMHNSDPLSFIFKSLVSLISC